MPGLVEVYRLHLPVAKGYEHVAKGYKHVAMLYALLWEYAFIGQGNRHF
jgi:hypothetical protein